MFFFRGGGNLFLSHRWLLPTHRHPIFGCPEPPPPPPCRHQHATLLLQYSTSMLALISGAMVLGFVPTGKLCPRDAPLLIIVARSSYTYHVV